MACRVFSGNACTHAASAAYFLTGPSAEEDQDKTEYITLRGQWRFHSLPMGLSNSPGTLMDMVLQGLTWASVLVYIDDIVVYAHSYTELKERLSIVFQRLLMANIKFKPTKVCLFQHEITFFGHRTSAHGVAMDDNKIAEVVQWPLPRNVHEICMFLELCGYYRRYVRDFTAHAYGTCPIHVG